MKGLDPEFGDECADHYKIQALSNTMDIYRQKELYRTELLKHIFNLDVAGVTNVLQMTNPYGNFEFTYGLRMLHDLFGSESRFKEDCGRSKFTIEQLITHIASYTNVWCSHGDKLT